MQRSRPDTDRRDMRREKREGVSATRGVLLAMAAATVAWIALIVLLVWLL